MMRTFLIVTALLGVMACKATTATTPDGAASSDVAVGDVAGPALDSTTKDDAGVLADTGAIVDPGVLVDAPAVDTSAVDALADVAQQVDTVIVTDVADVADLLATIDVAPDAGPDIAPEIGVDAFPDTATIDDGCHVGTDCKNGAMCFAPGESIGCGICFSPQETCASDADCKSAGATFICKPVHCACSGEHQCVQGCQSEADCAAWQFCAPNGNCVNDVCLQTKDCLPNFECTPPGNPHCNRKACQADAECAGYCVKGFCYDAEGFCSFPPP